MDRDAHDVNYIEKEFLMMDYDTIEIDLLQVMKALLKKGWLILLAAVICGGAMFGYGKYSYTPSYKASTTLVVRYTNSRDVIMGENEGMISFNSVDDARKLVNTSIEVLKSRSTLEEVIAESGLNLTAGGLSGRISAASVNNTELFTVSVTGTDAEEAMALANTIGKVLPRQMEKVNANFSLAVMDEAELPEDSGAAAAMKKALVAAVCGAFLVCAVVGGADIVTQVKNKKKKNG